MAVNLVLIGHKGCGKTTFGKQLSDSLSLPFIDTDNEIEKEHTLPIKEVYKKLGKEQFRKLEQTVISSLSPNTPTVISIGGGALECQENQLHLKKIGHLIFLKQPLKEAIDYFQKNPIPNFKRNDVMMFIKKRESLFLSLADKIISKPFCDHIIQLKEMIS